MENSIEEDIKILEENLKNGTIYVNCGNSIDKALENLLTRYKQLDSLIGETDNKEVNDALHMLLHCALKTTEYETQKQQFQIVNAYIKQLEEENKNMAEEYLVNNPGMAKYLNDNYIFKSKVKDKIEELEKEIVEKQENCCDFTLIHEHEIDTIAIIKVLQELLESEE